MPDKQPNYLLIVTDDCTYSDLPLHGGRNAHTPNINKLASEGTTFDQAHLSEAMCQPCRAELYTGMYPMRNGCTWNHSASRPEVTSMPHHLRELGFRVGIAGKIHVKPEKTYPFERVGGFDRCCVHNPTEPHSVEDITEFMDRDQEEPFCLVVALVEPHTPWVMGDPSQYPPESVELPPNIADTEWTRKAFSHYLAEITYMDGQVGDILNALESTGKADNTMVMFSSEQGAQFPGAKWTNWNLGLHTSLIARWPGVVQSDRRTDALVQYADVLPTLVEAAGGDPERYDYDGTSFLSVLRGETDDHRAYAYGMHNNIPEGPPYPVRTVFNGQYRYIRNLTPEKLYMEKHQMGIPEDGELQWKHYWGSWIRNAGSCERTRRLVERQVKRPAEELYHTVEDPFEMNNLAEDGDLENVKEELSDQLDCWMEKQGDPGVSQDTKEAYDAACEGNHLYGPGSE